MRVIAGELKGRKLQAPGWPGLRPTSDKLRETLFNILAPTIGGRRVLDGYAGTGAVGIEALSRGASHVTFVEQDPRAIALIESNLATCGVATRGPAHPQERYAIIRAWFAAAAKRLEGTVFDMIFLDPPYGATELADAIAAAEPLVGTGTLLVIEHAKRDAAPDRAGALARRRAVVSGDSALAFYERSPGDRGQQ